MWPRVLIKDALHWLCQQLFCLLVLWKAISFMMYVTSASEIFLCKATCSNSYEVVHWSVQREHAAPMFIWHARGSEFCHDDGRQSWEQHGTGSANSLLISSFPIREYRTLVENKKFLWNLFWLHKNGLDGFLIFRNSRGGFLEVVETSSVSSFNVKSVLWNNYSDRSWS